MTTHEDFEQWIRPREAPCDTCGAPGRKWGASRAICQTCAERREEQRAQKEERERVIEAQRRRERLILTVRGQLPKRYRWASFEAQELPARVRDRGAISSLMAKGLDASMVTLTGPAGAGKTSLAACLLLARALRDDEDFVRFVFPPDLILARQSNRLGMEDAGEVAEAKRCAILVLDDLGQEPDSAWSKVLVEVLHERHAEMRATIVTTFLSPDDVAARYGGGVARRLFEECAIPVGAKSGLRR